MEPVILELQPRIEPMTIKEIPDKNGAGRITKKNPPAESAPAKQPGS